MVSFTHLAALLAGVAPALAAFGVTNTGSSYIVDAGSANPLVVAISKKDCSITSLKYRGAEYQYKSQTSHIASGLGSATVSYSTIAGLSLTFFYYPEDYG